MSGVILIILRYLHRISVLFRDIKTFSYKGIYFYKLSSDTVIHDGRKKIVLETGFKTIAFNFDENIENWHRFEK